MQKVPILPTTPWQGGDPDFSNPSAAPVVVVTYVRAVLVHSQADRAAQHAARIHRPLIVRGAAIVKPSGKSVVRSQARSRIRRLGHQIAIVTRPAAQLGVRREKTIKGIYLRQAPNTARRTRLRRHDVQILRAPLFARARLAIYTRTLVKRTPRAKLERHRAFIFKAPFVSAVAVTQTTIKYVYTHSIARASRQRAKLAKNPAVILRSTIIGVRREKTIKGIYLHGVGRFEHIAKHRRHKPSIAKAGLRVSTPTGRVSLHPVDRQKSAKLRRARLAFVFRSRGGVAVVVTEKTLKSIFLRPTTRSQRLEARFRRHKARIARAPIVVKRGTVLAHPVERNASGKLRRHRLLVVRPPRTGVPRAKTVKPIFVRVLRNRHLGWLRRHFVTGGRSVGGQNIIYIDYYDHPEPRGIMSSSPAEDSYDTAEAGSVMSSSPDTGAFDTPKPIGGLD